MTEREKIIALAYNAGFDIERADRYHNFDEVLDHSNRWITLEIESLVKQAQADAFEQAAKVCETFDPHPNQWSEPFEYTQQTTANNCAQAIRQLGKEKS